MNDITTSATHKADALAQLPRKIIFRFEAGLVGVIFLFWLNFLTTIYFTVWDTNTIDNRALVVGLVITVMIVGVTTVSCIVAAAEGLLSFIERTFQKK